MKFTTAVLDPSASSAAWAGGLRPYDAALASAVRELDIAGQRAIVFHESADAMAAVFSVPGTLAEGMRAARLALTEQFPHAASDHPSVIAPLSRDASKTAHTIISAELDAAAATLEAWASRAGLRCEGVLPLHTAHLALHAGAEIKSHSSGVTIALRVGERASMLAGSAPAGAGSAGRRLLFARRIDFSLDSLAEVLTRPIQPRSVPDGPPIELTREQAAALLHTHGIPAPESVLDRVSGLRGSDVLPLIQPALQRCVVELKQSLRFGLAEQERAAATLVVCGPGATVCRLAEVLAGPLGLNTGAGEAAPSEIAPEAVDLADAHRGAQRTGLMLPRVALVGRQSAAMKRALCAGAALAAVVLGTDAWVSFVALQSSSAEANRLEVASAQARELEASVDRVKAKRGAIASLRSAIESTVGRSAPLRAVLAEVSQLSPPAVRSSSISAQRAGERHQLVITGHALALDGRDGQAALDAYADSLRASPLVAGVTLGTTQRVRLDDHEAIEFTLTADLVALASHAAAEAAGGEP